MTITDFLLARITEDADDYGKLTREQAEWMTDDAGRPPSYYNPLGYNDRLTPERGLAECATKLRIIELHAYYPEPHRDWGWCSTCGDVPQVDFPCETIRALTTIYADHPDYQPEWKL